MYAIASLLDPVSDQTVRGLWERFESHCGLTGIRYTPVPHFSWQGAEGYQIEPVETALFEVAKQIEPFTVRAAGLGIFTGPVPVVYVALVKDERLFRLHQALWERIHPYAIAANEHYHPLRWIPHITLALHEVDPDRLGCAVADMAFERVAFEITVDQLALLYSQDGTAGLKSRFKFRAQSLEEVRNL